MKLFQGIPTNSAMSLPQIAAYQKLVMFGFELKVILDINVKGSSLQLNHKL